jgi:Derlin-2/3
MGDNYLQNAYNNISPVARVWLIGVVAVTFAVKFGLLPLSLVFFTPQAVLVKLQLWRLLSSFFWVGKLELAWLINLFMT